MFNKYMIDVESASLCPDNNELEIPMRKCRIDRINRTHRAISMDFSFAQPVNRSSEIGLTIEKWTEGAWHAIRAIPRKTNFCNVLDSPVHMFKDMFVNLKKVAGLKHPERCDFPAGNYSVRYPVDITGDVPFWSGRFRATVVVKRIKNYRKVFCAQALVNLVEVPE